MRRTNHGAERETSDGCVSLWRVDGPLAERFLEDRASRARVGASTRSPVPKSEIAKPQVGPILVVKCIRRASGSFTARSHARSHAGRRGADANAEDQHGGEALMELSGPAQWRHFTGSFCLHTPSLVCSLSPRRSPRLSHSGSAARPPAGGEAAESSRALVSLSYPAPATAPLRTPPPPRPL